MHRLRTEKMKKVMTRGIARLLAAALLFGVIGSHADGLTITAQAAEEDECNVLSSFGINNSAVIKADGSLWMWGYNGSGQLGNGTKTDSLVPVKIMDDVKSLSMDRATNDSAVIKTDGSLWTWGYNKYGELGNGTKTESLVPVKILDDVKSALIVNNNGVAIKTDGSLWMWGENDDGNLGNGTKAESLMPVKIMDDVKSFSVTGQTSAAIKTDGSLWMWGKNNIAQLGNGTTTDSLVPVKIMDDVKSFSVTDMGAAIKTDGSLWMWGRNSDGQLGNGTTTNSLVPVKILDDVKSVSHGSRYNAAIKTDGSLWMWGYNNAGQLGDGTTTDSLVPVKILDNVKNVSLSSGYSAAVKTDGSLWMWGTNAFGQLGDGTETDSHVPVKILDNVKSVSLGSVHSAAIKTDGSLWTWGRCDDGQLGNGTGGTGTSLEKSLVPIQIMPPGSISTSGGASTPDDPDNPDTPGSPAIFIDETSDALIKVVDADGKPIKDATLDYNQKKFTTSDTGVASLDNYQLGKELVISKEGYATKTIPSFIKRLTGMTTYALPKVNGTGGTSEGGTSESGGSGSDKLVDLAESIYLVRGKETIDLLTQEAQLNTYYKNSVNSKFEIICTFQEKYDYYTLYSGGKQRIGSEGKFSNLSLDFFTPGEPVTIGVQNRNRAEIIKELSLHVVNEAPPVNYFHLGGDAVQITFPDSVPIIGGKKLEVGELGNLPVDCYYKSDGTVQLGFNVDWLMKKKGLELPELFPSLKNLTTGNASSFMGRNYQASSQSSAIMPDFTIIGYAESNIKNPDYIQGKLFVEFSLAYAHEQQLSVGPVPVVVELSIEGKINADGSIMWSVEEGFGGSLGVGGEFGVGVYGGVGIANLGSAGIYGDAAFGLHYVILPADNRKLDKLYLGGELGLEAKALGKSFKCSLINGTYYIIGEGVSVKSSAENGGWENVSLDDYASYNMNSRSYLTADGTMPEWEPDSGLYINGSMEETVLQSSLCFDTVPQVIRMGDTVMLFYLTDAGTARNAADRSILVYSLWDEIKEEWGEPQAVLDDGTADYSPDFYTDGEKIYAVWQDATENLSDDLSLEETAKRMALHAAVYDEAQRSFTDLGRIESENGLFQQKPQIAADDNGVSVYWYENAQDNVLGLAGANRIYRAEFTGQNALTTEDVQTMSVSEEEELPSEAMEESISEETEESVSENTEEAASESTEESPSEETETEEMVSEEEETEDSSQEFTAPKEDALLQDVPAAKKAGSVSENTIPEDGGDNDTPALNPEEESGEKTETSEESISDNNNALPEKSVSENTVSGNTIQTNTYNAARQADRSWTAVFLQEEENCIFSADAGKMNGKAGYAFAAGTMDESYNVKDSKAAFIEQGQNQIKVLKNGAAEKVEFAPVYADETLTWYEAGDICYIDANGSTVNLFGESRIPSWSYTLLSDGTAPEVFFPVNAGGKSNLYRIGYENGTFLPSLQVTEQEDYIQYADGFIRGGETILVYNKMKVNDKLEEVNNSLCTGTIAHSYCDLVMQSAGSMVLYNEETGENELEIAVQLYNNGTTKAENLSLSLCATDGSVLESVPMDLVLEAGETDNTSAVFSLDHITQEAEYTITLSGAEETNKENNSIKLTLGGAALQVEANAISIGDTRTIQAGIQNTGVTACGGTVSLQDSETGEEYAGSSFEPIEKGKTAVVEIELPSSIFKEKEELALEVVVTSDSEKVETVRDFVKVYIPSYEVNFVTDAGTSTVYANYGTIVSFPENPVKDGKYFIGWYDAKTPASGTLYTEEMPIKKSVTLYACFADEERAQIPMSECSVLAIPIQYYTGSAIKPKLTVKWGSVILKNNKDYTVAYQNNKEQGKAAVTITGKGKYSGSISRNFMIYYPISKVSVKAIPAVNYTGENFTPELTVTYQKKALVKGTDYTVTYSNNRNAGTAGVTITGKGKYNGQKTVTFQIKGTAISSMEFEKIPNVTYNGAAAKPIITIKTKEGQQLMPGSDYRLVYENTVQKGTASVTVIGNGNYTGTKKLSYKIVAKPLTEAMIFQVAEQTYTGSAIKPAVTVTDQEAGRETLVLNKDYTISYSKNKAVGTAQITVKGKGNYGGTVKIPFTINPLNLAEAQTEGKIDVRVNDMAYTGKALKPAVSVYAITDGKEKKIPAGGYTVTYANNTEMGTGTVTITGKEKSGYTGTVTAQFRIVEKAKLITASTIKIEAIPAQTFTGKEQKPAIHIVDKSDKTKEITLVQDTDYEITYKNNVNAGKATVTVKGIGSYAGSKNITFKVNKCPIADKNVLGQGFSIEKMADMKYTGYALKPDVVLKDKGTTLEQGKDYKLSYKNNTKIGAATVTVKGMGNYSGSINTVGFQIVSWDYNTLRAEVENQTYTGKALKPKITFYAGEETIDLKSGTAVKIDYKDNKNVGTAAVTVSGKGELREMEPLTLTFAVESADLTDAVVSRIANQNLKGVPVKPVPKVKVGKNSLKAGRDFTVSYLQNGVKGEATVIIRGVGNYTGECSKTFIVQ
ncbi:MAG: InlB B-repeat-containing protein [Muribaculaceae bacterium]|nr:InlB B-repeat-containing protein [Muribaculaceae bacterium]